MSSIIHIENVSFAYEQAPVLEDVNLHIERGDFFGIIGPNGGGKTTLLKLMLGLLKPQSGIVRIFGGSPVPARNRIGYVPQYSNHDSTFPITAYEVVAMGVSGPGVFFPFGYTHDKKERIDNALERVGMGELRERLFGTLSGGERQRVLIARALANGPEILMLDEPTASVDNTAESDIYELFRELNEAMTIVLVSHDIGVVSSHANRVACINRRAAVHNVKDVAASDIVKDAYISEMTMLRHRCNL